MNELAKIGIFLGVGLASGFVFFVVLDRLNARLARRAEEGKARTSAYIAATLALRLALLGAIVYASLRTGIGYLFVTFLGFMIARGICLRFFQQAEGEEEEN